MNSTCDFFRRGKSTCLGTVRYGQIVSTNPGFFSKEGRRISVGSDEEGLSLGDGDGDVDDGSGSGSGTYFAQVLSVPLCTIPYRSSVPKYINSSSGVMLCT